VRIIAVFEEKKKRKGGDFPNVETRAKNLLAGRSRVATPSVSKMQRGTEVRNKKKEARSAGKERENQFRG